MEQQGTVLITGASGGIGFELAKLFASSGYDLVLVARGRDKLDDAARVLWRGDLRVDTIPMDLADSASPRLLFDELLSRGIFVDVLVNNAGYGKLGDLADIALEESLGQIQLNIAALTALTRLFLGPMIERGRGKILNVASLAGFQPGPHMAVYYATKAFVISFSEAIAEEVREKGVVVTCLCPGVTDTQFQYRAGTDKTGLFRLPPMDAAAVARDGYDALMTGASLRITGFRNRLIARGVRIAPRRLVVRLSRKLLESMNP